MIESGLAFALLLDFENSINNKRNSNYSIQSKSRFKNIHKVLNYDYFIENNISENLQIYEEIFSSNDNSNRDLG